MRMKVFLSTMWDLYFFWRFDCKEKSTMCEFEKDVKKHLSFLFHDNEPLPDLTDAIKELYIKYPSCIIGYYQCSEERGFVDKYSD
mgnify:CR=1 FL=1